MMSFIALIFALHHWYVYNVKGQFDEIRISFNYAKFRILSKLSAIWDWGGDDEGEGGEVDARRVEN